MPTGPVCTEELAAGSASHPRQQQQQQQGSAPREGGAPGSRFSLRRSTGSRKERNGDAGAE